MKERPKTPPKAVEDEENEKRVAKASEDFELYKAMPRNSKAATLY